MKFKKIVCIICTIAILCCIIPTGTFAAESLERINAQVEWNMYNGSPRVKITLSDYDANCTYYAIMHPSCESQYDRRNLSQNSVDDIYSSFVGDFVCSLNENSSYPTVVKFVSGVAYIQAEPSYWGRYIEIIKKDYNRSSIFVYGYGIVTIPLLEFKAFSVGDFIAGQTTNFGCDFDWLNWPFYEYNGVSCSFAGWFSNSNCTVAYSSSSTDAYACFELSPLDGTANYFAIDSKYWPIYTLTLPYGTYTPTNVFVRNNKTYLAFNVLRSLHTITVNVPDDVNYSIISEDSNGNFVEIQDGRVLYNAYVQVNFSKLNVDFEKMNISSYAFNGQYKTSFMDSNSITFIANADVVISNVQFIEPDKVVLDPNGGEYVWHAYHERYYADSRMDEYKRNDYYAIFSNVSRSGYRLVSLNTEADGSGTSISIIENMKEFGCSSNNGTLIAFKTRDANYNALYPFVELNSNGETDIFK